MSKLANQPQLFELDYVIMHNVLTWPGVTCGDKTINHAKYPGIKMFWDKEHGTVEMFAKDKHFVFALDNAEHVGIKAAAK